MLRRPGDNGPSGDSPSPPRGQLVRGAYAGRVGKRACTCVAQEWRALRLALGLTQGQMAAMLGFSTRHWKRFESAGAGHRCLPTPADRLLRVYLAFPQARGRLQRAGYTLPEGPGIAAAASTPRTAAPAP